MVQESSKRSFPQEYLPVPGAAARIGVSERTVWTLIKDPVDPLPTYRIGRKIVRVKVSELDAWMKKRRVDSSEVDRIVNEILG